MRLLNAVLRMHLELMTLPRRGEAKCAHLHCQNRNCGENAAAQTAAVLEIQKLHALNFQSKTWPYTSLAEDPRRTNGMMPPWKINTKQESLLSRN